MNIALITKEHFGSYKRGERIDDPALVEQILHSEHAHLVQKIIVPVEFKPSPVVVPAAPAKLESGKDKNSKE